MDYHELTDKELADFKRVSEKGGITYETDEEYREAAQNLYSFVSLTLDMAIEENGCKKRLEIEPKGYSMAGEGRNCSLCGQSVYEGDGWYDKWGFKCMNCQDAINKKEIPGSLCGDYKHEKYVTEDWLCELMKDFFEAHHDEIKITKNYVQKLISTCT